MKLRNKLIPLASIFATGAVMAPVALTSCSAASGMVDLTSGNYAITTKKAKTEGYVATEDLAMGLWTSSISANPDVFIQDRYWCDAALIKGFADLASINVTSIKGECKNVSVKYVTVRDGATDRKIPTISMTYTLAVESNWSVTGGINAEEIYISKYAQYAAQMGSPLYYPICKYYYDKEVSGTIYSTNAYEATWENVPVDFFELDKSIPTKYLPKILTEVTKWYIHPSLNNIQLMDANKLDWKYTVRYAKEDTFVFTKDGAETSKVNGSSLDRSFHTYDQLNQGPSTKESEFYTKGSGLLTSETIASYYLSDLTKVKE